MRKLIAIGIMIFVSVFFFKSFQTGPEKKGKKQIVEVISDMKNSVEGAYPENPINIVEDHNVMTNIIYGKEITDIEFMEAIKLQRGFYAEDFLALNPLEDHVEKVQNELILNAEKEIRIIGSAVINSYHNPPGTIRVQVVHYTNKQDQDLVREYVLKEEKSSEASGEKQWKIYGWTNMGTVKSQEEQE